MRMALVVALALMAFSATTAETAAAETGNVVGAPIATAPVEVDGNVLFTLRGVSALPAAERAAVVKARIQALARDPAVRTADLHVVESGIYFAIMAGDVRVIALVEADARMEHVTLRTLADLYRHRIVWAIDEYRSARTPEHLMENGLRALGATLAFALAIGLVLWLARRLDALVERRFRRRIKSLEIHWRQVEAILLTAADRTPGLLKEPAPFVLQRKLGDFAVEYEVNAYCRDPHDMTALYTALHRNILDQFNEYGVQVMTPAYESDPAQPKVVPKQGWYASPAVPPGAPEH